MFKYLLYLLLLVGQPLFSQTTYTGFIDKYPIELVTYIYGDGDARAIYMYTKYDTPITINGRQDGSRLVLKEKDKNDAVTATLAFNEYSEDAEVLAGIWTETKTGKQLKIALKKEWDVIQDDLRPIPKYLLQTGSTNRHYFRQQLAVTSDGTKMVKGVNVYEKKTDKLIQCIPADCEIRGLDALLTGDFNFDGYSDFSMFEASYAGANTTSLYFLYDPKTGKYFESGFEGTSLEFNQQEKRVYEQNSCCGGTESYNAVYKIVNNQMVLIERHCYKYDEEKNDMLEMDCSQY